MTDFRNLQRNKRRAAVVLMCFYALVGIFLAWCLLESLIAGSWRSLIFWALLAWLAKGSFKGDLRRAQEVWGS